ncbi:MAG: T9SS type A sorting domain-containing protein [Bacteroidetes bacterium]|nr:T9SS type A sorting domain-containing protein [Bacteroidota bacterium]
MKKIFVTICLVAVSAIILTAQNPRNVVLYNLTSTECGPCSCMDSIVNARVSPEFSNTIVLALHGPGSYFGQYRGDSACSFFNAQYEPSGFIDGLGFDVPFASVRDSLASRYSRNPDAPVKLEFLSKTWVPATRIVNMQIRAANIGANISGTYWYNVIVTEGNIKHIHHTNTGCATPDVQGLPYRENYFNHNIVRKMEFWRKGDSLIGPSWPANASVTKSVSVSLDSAWVPENCQIAVIVYKYNDSLYKAPIQQAIRQSVTGGLGLSEFKPQQDGIIQIYPNPSQGVTNIHFAVTSDGECALQIFNLSGRLIETVIEHPVSQGIYNAELDTRGYESGQYFCVFKTPYGKTTQSFLVK